MNGLNVTVIGKPLAFVSRALEHFIEEFEPVKLENGRHTLATVKDFGSRERMESVMTAFGRAIAHFSVEIQSVSYWRDA